MEQRRLRLGDILDDYCPRERRVTNHAVVAMIDEDVKQTRCTTCDAEHVYKGGQAPRRRKTTAPALTVPGTPMTAQNEPHPHHDPDVADEPVVAAAAPVEPAMAEAPESEQEPDAQPPGFHRLHQASGARAQAVTRVPLGSRTCPRRT